MILSCYRDVVKAIDRRRTLIDMVEKFDLALHPSALSSPGKPPGTKRVSSRVAVDDQDASDGKDEVEDEEDPPSPPTDVAHHKCEREATHISFGKTSAARWLAIHMQTRIMQGFKNYEREDDFLESGHSRFAPDSSKGSKRFFPRKGRYNWVSRGWDRAGSAERSGIRDMLSNVGKAIAAGSPRGSIVAVGDSTHKLSTKELDHRRMERLRQTLEWIKELVKDLRQQRMEMSSSNCMGALDILLNKECGDLLSIYIAVFYAENILRGMKTKTEWKLSLLEHFAEEASLENFVLGVSYREIAQNARALWALSQGPDCPMLGKDANDNRRLLLNLNSFIMYRDYLVAMADAQYNAYTAALMSPGYWDKALLSLIVQFMMYLGGLSQEASGSSYASASAGTSGGTSVIYTQVMVVLVVVFTFFYSVSNGLTELYLNSLFMFAECQFAGKLLLVANFSVNCCLTMTLPIITARVLNDSENFMDVVLNSVAMYFVAELDDVIINGIDLKELDSARVRRIIDAFGEYSVKDTETVTLYATHEVLVVLALMIIATVAVIVAIIIAIAPDVLA